MSMTQMNDAYLEATEYGDGGSCFRCSAPLWGSSEFEAGGQFFHRECMTCIECNCSLSAVQSPTVYRNDIWCSGCFESATADRFVCQKCMQPVPWLNELLLVKTGDGRTMSVHAECYRCFGCGASMPADGSVRLRVGNDRVYCTQRCVSANSHVNNDHHKMAVTHNPLFQ